MSEIDPSYWQFLDVLVRSRRNAPEDVYPRLMESAYRGEIAWDYVVASRLAVRGLNKLFVDMANQLDTADQLAGLLQSMHDVSQQTSGSHARFRATTGGAGMILLARARARGDAGTKPLPAGWQDVCRESIAKATKEVVSGQAKGPSSAAYWAGHMLKAGLHGPGRDLAG